VVDAGLLVNFPALAQAEWVQEALQMEAELTVLRHMHKEYQDGYVHRERSSISESVKSVLTMKPSTMETTAIPSVAIKIAPTPTKVTLAEVAISEGKLKNILAEQELELLPFEERMVLVQDFSKALKNIDERKPLEAFKKDLLHIVSIYKQQVRQVLVNNVNFKRVDVGSKANRGDLHALFFPNRSNHRTGKPVTGKLLYQKDVSDSFFSTKMEDVGLLVEHPQLAQEPFIQEALQMEQELTTLLAEHVYYLADESFSILQ
jgi:hypothetical protein